MRLETLELPTADLSAQRAFYGERLGFDASFEGPEALRVSVGASTLRFRHAPGFEGRYHFALAVPLAKVGAAAEHLRGRAVEPLRDGAGTSRFRFDFWDAEATYFSDPGGNVVEFIGRAEIPSSVGNSPEFSADDVLGLSEVGLACDDVPRTAAWLARELGVGGYRDVGPEFHPLGDAHGLLVLVPEGRTWFPDTGVRAQALPLSLTLSTERGRFRLETAPLRVARAPHR